MLDLGLRLKCKGSKAGESALNLVETFKAEPNLLRLYRSFDLNDVTQPSPTLSITGSNVTGWDDESGNGYHATQGTLDNQPRIATDTQTGVSSVEFIGLRYLESTCPVPTRRTQFVVFNFDRQSSEAGMPAGGFGIANKGLAATGICTFNPGWSTNVSMVAPNARFGASDPPAATESMVVNSSITETAIYYGYLGDANESLQLFKNNTEVGNIATRTAHTPTVPTTYAIGASKDTNNLVSNAFGGSVFHRGDLLFVAEYSDIKSVAVMESLRDKINETLGIY